MDLKKIEKDLSNGKYTLEQLFEKRNEIDDYIASLGDFDINNKEKLLISQNAHFLNEIISNVIRQNSHNIKISK